MYRSVNDSILATSRLTPRRVDLLRNLRAPLEKNVTSNWAPEVAAEFDRWYKHTQHILADLSDEELTELEPHYGVLSFANLATVNDQENVTAVFIRIASALGCLLKRYNTDSLMLKEFLRSLLKGHVVPPTPLLLMGTTSAFSKSTASCYLVTGPKETPNSDEYTMDLLSIIAKLSKNGGAVGCNMSGCGAGYGAGGCLQTVLLYSALLENYPQNAARQATGALYLETWHADIFEFIALRGPKSKNQRATDRIYPAVWVCDAFMEAVRDNTEWYLYDPNKHGDVVKLIDLHGDEYRAHLKRLYERQLYCKTILARDLLVAIVNASVSSGAPFVLFKDTINRTSSHSVYGTITSSNLCTEIVQYKNSTEVATCSLMSLNVEKILQDTTDYARLREPMRQAVFFTTLRALQPPKLGNNVTQHTDKSRPIGIGIQGFTDLLYRLKIDYEESGPILKSIFEHLYYYGLEASADMVSMFGKFDKFEESYYAKGKLHFDFYPEANPSLDLSWNKLREHIKQNGLANSLLLAQMPTSHSSTMWNASEWFEPLSKLIERKKTIVGEFFIVNKSIKNDDNLVNQIITEQLSGERAIQSKHFKSGWDIPIMSVLRVWADAIPFIDQSASLSWYFSGKISDVITGLIYCWRRQFKTGLYYLHVKPLGTNKQFIEAPALACNNCSA